MAQSNPNNNSNIRELQPMRTSKNKEKTEGMVVQEEHQDIETGKMPIAIQASGRPSSARLDRVPSDRYIGTGRKVVSQEPNSGRQPSREQRQFSLDVAGKAKSERSTSLDTTARSTETAETAEAAAEVSVITEIDAYAGSTLEEKIEAMIASHPVVMFNRTWCLFSVDAINFLVKQLNVPVHSVEVDVHSQGKEILKYVTEKTKHNTTPFIFIRGEFLGGFSEVNALYARGTLQKQYLKGLSQADQCEAFISNSKYQMSTYFWFPDKVDANVVRFTGCLTFFASALSAVLVHFEEFFWARYVAYVVAIDFLLRLLGGARVSVFGRIAMFAAYPFDPVPRMGKPKQFATCLGFLFSALASVAFLAPFPYNDYVGSGFMAALALATGMEGFADFCVGCLIFKICVKLGLFKGTS